MATSTDDGFSRTLEKFRRTLSDVQRRAFSSTSLDDVKKAMQDIQDKIGPGKRLRNFTRLKKFLEGMKQMEELVKVFAQVHEVVAFVWRPIKLTLMIAATKVETLELLLGVYQEIGDVLHGVERYTRLFKKHFEGKQILETYFYDVLQFHTEVLKVFTKPGWKRLFTYAWPTFKTRFRPIINSLKRHQGLLSDEKHTIVIEEVQELSADFKDKFAELRQAISESDAKHQESIASQKSRIIARINPLGYESDHDLVAKNVTYQNPAILVIGSPKIPYSEVGLTIRRLTTFFTFTRAWVILDGLDECGEEHEINKPESQRVLKWLREDLFPACQAQDCQIRLLISGQRDGYVDAILSKCPEINLDTADAHVFDIRDYTKFRTSTIREDFSLDSAQEADIIERVVSTSKGMFLYAKVVLDNLISQESTADLDDELTQDHFPRGLDAAYERVVIRVLDRPSPSRKKSALMVLGWLICSARPLRWREIQSKFCIDPEKATCNFRNRRVHGCKAICGSLVEVEPCEYHGDSVTEQTISLVHNTAGRYLVESGRLRLYEEHSRMAIFCARYLSSSPFDKEQFADTIEKFALTGYYGLLDYASAFWQLHVNFVLTCKSSLDVALQDEVVQSVARLLEGWGTDKQTRKPLVVLDIAFIESRMAEWLRDESDFTGPFKHIINIRRVVEAPALTRTPTTPSWPSTASCNSSAQEHGAQSSR
ncbi:hypothetical protein QQZ08_004434 [Neonectria magnoliae]|uniref:DUF7708 domain-containing protein n=1 Tax=Neonectria magnoliae TaxID=2732573 RepID=A0ABR1I630_9HYPO